VTDVLVIGGGLAGWRAAEAAVRAGASVALVANGDGNSPHIHALNCPVLDGDSAATMAADTLSSGHGTNDPELVRVLCEGAVKLKDEFAFDRDEKGVYKTIQPLGSTVPRCVSINHAIGAYALREIQAALRGKVKVIEGRAEKLEREQAQGEDALPTKGGCVGGAQGEDALPTKGGRVGGAQSEDALPTKQCGQGVPALTKDTVWSGRPRPDTYPSSYFPGLDGSAIRAVKVGRGEALPHWELTGALYHLVFRLHDSIPVEVYRAWQEEETSLRVRAKADMLSAEDAARLRWLSHDCVDRYLDDGRGACRLRCAKVMDVVLKTLARGNEDRYFLHAVGLMPNHLHLVLQLADGQTLDGVAGGIKSTVAHLANRVEGRKGDFWQSDYYNHIIRTREEYDRQVAYVGVDNAGVFGWRMGKGVTERRWAQGEDALPTTGGRVGGAQGEDALPTMRVTVRCGQGVPALTLMTKTVILATGGWCGKYDFSTNPPYLQGDGIVLAEALGAATRDMDAVQYEPTVRVEGSRRGIPVITTLLYKGAKMRNMSGEEFLPDARLNKDKLSQAIFAEMKRTGASGVWYDLTDVAEADLAACHMPLDERRILVAPAPHTSLGGLVIDTECHVLRPDGTPILGLYAAGEVTGGLHGRNRLGGNAGTEVLVFGRIAGETAAREVR